MFITRKKRCAIPGLILALLLAACGGGGGEHEPSAAAPTGSGMVVQASAAPAGACEGGGVKVDAGLDISGDGVLGMGEVTGTQVVCDGATGPAGMNGTNGFSTMMKVDPAQGCPHGGTRITAWLDSTPNGQLDPEEAGASSATEVCDGGPGDSMNWVVIDGSQPQQASPRTGYLATGQAEVVVTLPDETSNPELRIGDRVHVKGDGQGSWKIAQRTDQRVYTRALGSPMSGNWVASASSEDGTALVIADADGQIYTSANGGGSWTARPVDSAAEPPRWESVASSGDGQYLVAGARGGLWVSDNGGDTWIERHNEQSASWNSVASSRTGEFMVAASTSLQFFASGSLVFSEDHGETWKPLSAPLPAVPDGIPHWSDNWIAVAISETEEAGDKVAKLVTLREISDRNVLAYALTRSADDGTWALAGEPVIGDWLSVASSADGINLVAVGGGKVASSTNGGLSWDVHQDPHEWASVASSATGDQLFAIRPNWMKDYLYASIDHGETWTPAGPSGYWYSVSSAAGGRQLLAVGTGDGHGSDSLIYASQATTTVGPTGSISGSGLDQIELMYLGNGRFDVVTHEGTLTVR